MDKLMIICPRCGKSHSSVECCEYCQLLLHTNNGIPLFNPEVAFQNSGFKPEHYVDLFRQEANSFWFTERNKFIFYLIDTFACHFTNYIEFGCGTGFVLKGVTERYPGKCISGTDIYLEGLQYARQRAPNVKCYQLDLLHLPWVDEFDLIGIFDVLEHIEDDEKVISLLHRSLKPNGIVIASVPQHPWMWSYRDENACHCRRYSAHDLHRKFRSAGFEILFSTSFVTLLFPAMIASRIIDSVKKEKRNKSGHQASALTPPAWINSFFAHVLAFERKIAQCHISLPFGGSRFVVAKKHDQRPDH